MSSPSAGTVVVCAFMMNCPQLTTLELSSLSPSHESRKGKGELSPSRFDFGNQPLPPTLHTNGRLPRRNMRAPTRSVESERASEIHR